MTDLGALPLHVISDREAMILHFHYVEGWTLTRIAAALHVNHQNTSRSHVSALSKIRAELEANRGLPCRQPQGNNP